MDSFRIVGQTSDGVIFTGGSDSILTIYDKNLSGTNIQKIELINGIQCGINYEEFIVIGIFSPHMI